MAQKNSMNIVEQLILKEFKFLEEFGYKSSLKTLHDNTAIASIEVEYRNFEKKNKDKLYRKESL